jgi:hypothetical protein
VRPESGGWRTVRRKHQILVARVRPSASAWATGMRSKGSFCSSGKPASLRICRIQMANV